MAVSTRRIDIPTLTIDRDFLTSLESIIDAEIKEATRGIKKTDLEYNLKTKYTLRSDIEDADFNSIHEILEYTSLSENIYALTISVNFYGNLRGKFVDIEININNKFSDNRTCILSSTDVGRLLNVREKIVRLFNQHKTNYDYLYKIINYNFFTSYIPNALISYSLSFRILDFIGDNTRQFKAELGLILWMIVAFIFTAIIGKIITFLFPKYNFSLYRKKPFNMAVRGALYTLLAAVLIQAIYDLGKFLLFLK